MAYQQAAYYPDIASGTALDVFRSQEHTAPPPGWGGSSQNKEQPTVWNYYTEKGKHYDKDLVEDANNTVDVLLIFAGLFSAVVTAFISQTYQMLRPDGVDTLNAILQELQNPGSTLSATPFVIPPYATRINCFLFTGLFISMIVALLSILVKQWTRSYLRDMDGISSPHLRARIRHFRYYGAKRWHFANIVGLLSICMHIALFISAVGIIDLLLSTAPTVGYVALIVFLLGTLFFFATSFLPLFVTDAPFRSPLSSFLADLKEKLPSGCRRRVFKGRIDEEGLEDHLEQSQGNESKEDSMVRTRIDLDLDILSQLLSEADKSTERWLLDLCLSKLPQLALLEKQDPESILRRKIITEVYIFLAKGCVVLNKYGEKGVDPNRLPRARKLCEFLAWLLSLRRTPEMRDMLRLRLTNRFDPKELPLTLIKDDNTTSLISVLSALGRVKHLDDERPEAPACPVCAETAHKLREMVDMEPPTTEEKTRTVIGLLIQRTDCLLTWDKNPSINQLRNKLPDLENETGVLHDLLTVCSITDRDRKAIERALREREGKVSDALKLRWFKRLLETVQSLQITRPPSPWRPDPSATSFTPSRLPSTTAPTGAKKKNDLLSGSGGSSLSTPTLVVPPTGV